MKWKKILNRIGNILMTFVFVFLAFIVGMAAFSIASGEQPNVLGYELKTVLSGSMEPSIKTGSIIVVQQTNESHLFEKDDIITFQTEERVLVTHRIIGKDGSQYITKGDNNNGPDVNPVHEKNIVGQYVGITIPYVGYVMNFANSQQGITFMLIIPGVFLLGYAIKSIIDSFKTNKKTMEKEQ